VRRVSKILMIMTLAGFYFWVGTVAANQASAQMPVSGDTQFFQSLPDVPLMEGLTELTDQTMEFDKPSGRIVEVYASYDSLSADQISSFYNQTLPLFGWQRLGDFSFVRKGEKLSFLFEDSDGQNFVRVTLLPVTNLPN